MREAMMRRLNRIQEERNGHPIIRHGIAERMPLSHSQANEVAKVIGVPPVQHIGCGMYAVLCEITPKMCMEWLSSRNTLNRHEVASHASTIASDMARGAFFLTHQGIAFDEQGEMIDGQHRCIACVTSGASFWSLVFIYVARTSCPGIDTGKKRDWKATRIMSGRDVSGQFQSVLYILASHDGTGLHKKSNDELDAHAELFDAGISFALEHMTSRTRGVNRAAVYAAIARAYFHCNQDSLKRFCEVLSTCRANSDSPAEDTIITLNRVLVTSGGKGGAQVNKSVYHKTLNAIDNYMKGKSVTRIFEASSSIYPLPQVATAIEAVA